MLLRSLQFVFFTIGFSIPVFAVSDHSAAPFQGVLPKDAIPDDKNFAVASDGRHVRKGTFKALRDNILLLDKFFQLPVGENRQEKIMGCAKAIQQFSPDLKSIGIFDWFFTISEWLQDDKKIGRIVATLAYLKGVGCQLDKVDKVLIKDRLQKLKTTSNTPEIQILIADVLKSLNHCKKEGDL